MNVFLIKLKKEINKNKTDQLKFCKLNILLKINV